MSMETVSRKKNRVYPRKFDHDEARYLRIIEGWGWERLAAHFEVSTNAVKRVCDPEFRKRFDQKTKDWMMMGECRACGGPRIRAAYHRRDQYEDSGLCRNCWAESQQNRFRFDELGNLASIRCTTCQQWKDADLFPSNKRAARGKHGQCRSCGTAHRQSYRERNKVPCVGCGAPALPASEKGPRRGREPRCRECFKEQQRTPEYRAAARERSLLQAERRRPTPPKRKNLCPKGHLRPGQRKTCPECLRNATAP